MDIRIFSKTVISSVMSNFTLALPISEINMVTHSFIPVHFLRFTLQLFVHTSVDESLVVVYVTTSRLRPQTGVHVERGAEEGR